MLFYAATFAALGGCASHEAAQERSTSTQTTTPWGDRTVAITYKTQDPIIAYFAPGEGGSGRMFVWDGGEDAVEGGSWRLDGHGRLCMTLAIYRKQSEPPAPLKSAAPFCTSLSGPLIGRFDYRGDVFDLNGKSDPPYILSSADNERIITVLASSERITR
ncbi:hypothetical protein [Methylopila sp. M107]|uniref:hypothetical protein n=1 Tax=Methylopila sp. M107 TaxID=1101190 RepID=UPI0003662DE3|nr:hypothetical protein [Methylopila sp. M107]